MNGANWLVVSCWNWAGGENSGVGRRGKCFEGRRTAMFSSELASVLTRITHPLWILVRKQSWATLMLHLKCAFSVDCTARTKPSKPESPPRCRSMPGCRPSTPKAKIGRRGGACLGRGVWCCCGGGCASTTEGASGGAHSREVSNAVPSLLYLRTRLRPRGPLFALRPQRDCGTSPLPPCRPPPPRPKVTRPEGQVPEVQHQDSLGIQPTPLSMPHPPPPPSHDDPRPPHAMCEYYASATGGTARSCLHQVGPARCQTRIYRILTPPSPEPHPPCRASLFLSSIRIPDPVAESRSVRAGSPPPEPSSQVSRSQPNTHTPDTTHLRRLSAARVGRRRKRQGKRITEASSSTSQELGRGTENHARFPPPHPRQQHHHRHLPKTLGQQTLPHSFCI